MREYRTRDDAERDADLDLHDLFKCEMCGREEELPAFWHSNNCRPCGCGGIFNKIGETHR